MNFETVYKIAYGDDALPFDKNKKNPSRFYAANLVTYLLDCKYNNPPEKSEINILDIFCYYFNQIPAKNIKNQFSNAFCNDKNGFDPQLFSLYYSEDIFKDFRIEHMTDSYFYYRHEMGIPNDVYDKYEKQIKSDPYSYKQVFNCFFLYNMDYYISNNEENLRNDAFDDLFDGSTKYKNSTRFFKKVAKRLNVTPENKQQLIDDCLSKLPEELVQRAFDVLMNKTSNTQTVKDTLKVSTKTKIPNNNLRSHTLEKPTTIPTNSNNDKQLKNNANKNNIDSNADIQDKLKNLNNLPDVIIGQTEAVNKIKNKILSSFVGFKNENKPLATFLLTGPTGVGKTETAKAIAKACFNNKFYTVDMTTFKYKTDVSRLTGSSPGYIGYDDTNTFSAFLTENPSSVILFDEIEKADPNCLDMLMSILDEGSFTTAKGVVVSLKDTIVFCTTNLTEYQKNKTENVGENLTSGENGLRKEIVGRFTDVIEYKKLNKKDCLKITEMFLNKTIQNFEKNNSNKIKLIYSNDLPSKIVEECNTGLFGARDLNKSIQKNFVDPISYYILENHPKNTTLSINKDLKIHHVQKQKNIENTENTKNI